MPSVEWESRRSAALEALSAALPAAGGGRLAEMIANRVRSLKEHACRFDSDGVLSAYSRTNAADPLSMPSAGAAVPAEIVREIEGEWRIRRVSTDELQRGVPSRVFGGGTDAARFGDVMARGKSTGESGAVPLPGPGIYVFEQENADSLRGIEVTVTDMVV